MPYPEQRDRSMDDSRDRRIRENRSRERRVPKLQHYAETMPLPLYYEVKITSILRRQDKKILY